MKLKQLGLAALLTLASLTVSATTMDDVVGLQHTWAKVNYDLTGDAQEKEFKDLVKLADDVVKASPSSAEAYIWRGIIQSSFAGAKGGLGALSLAKAAKADFEKASDILEHIEKTQKALSINPEALKGSAYTSLGTLYAKVPGWPLGFGDDDKAKEMLQKAVAINPTGIDANYFYASYLADEGETAEAEKYLLKAQQAPARPERPVADKGRQKEIAELLAKLKKEQEEQED